MTASPSSRTTARPERPRRTGALAAALALGALAGCSRGGSGADDASPEALAPWSPRYLQDQTLAILMEGRQSARARSTPRGAEPRAIARIPRSRRLVAALSGDDAVVALGPTGEELARTEAPPNPSALAFTRGGLLLVAGADAGAIARYELDAGADPPAFARRADQSFVGAGSLTAVATAGPAAGPGWVFVGDATTGAIYAAPVAVDDADGAVSQDLGPCAPPQALRATPRHLVASCAGEASIAVWSLAADGAPSDRPIARIASAGPVLGVAAAERWDPRAGRRRGALIAAGGLAAGHDEFVDLASYVTLHALTPGGEAERLAAVNVSRHVAAPTFVDLVQGDDGSVRVDVVGYGSDRRAALTWARGDFASSPAIETKPSLPGGVDAAPLPPGFAVASPLVGGFGVDLPELTFVPASPDPDPRPPIARVGEALAFTTLIGDPSTLPLGAACTLCHRVDTATRDDDAVGFATRLPALADKGRAASDAFATANADPDRDPFFAIEAADLPWLEDAGELPERLSPVLLRYALASFLASFEKAAHPIARGRRGEAAESSAHEGAPTPDDR